MKKIRAKTSFFVLIVAVFLAIGCTETTQMQKTTISEDKMVRLHADLLLANAAVANLYGPLRDSMLAIYHNQIFTINGVKKQEYEANLRIYAENMTAMDSIYAKTRVLLDSLEGAKKLD